MNNNPKIYLKATTRLGNLPRTAGKRAFFTGYDIFASARPQASRKIGHWSARNSGWHGYYCPNVDWDEVEALAMVYAEQLLHEESGFQRAAENMETALRAYCCTQEFAELADEVDTGQRQHCIVLRVDGAKHHYEDYARQYHGSYTHWYHDNVPLQIMPGGAIAARDAAMSRLQEIITGHDYYGGVAQHLDYSEQEVDTITQALKARVREPDFAQVYTDPSPHYLSMKSPNNIQIHEGYARQFWPMGGDWRADEVQLQIRHIFHSFTTPEDELKSSRWAVVTSFRDVVGDSLGRAVIYG